jgi:hypothetical protein
MDVMVAEQHAVIHSVIHLMVRIVIHAPKTAGTVCGDASCVYAIRSILDEAMPLRALKAI